MGDKSQMVPAGGLLATVAVAMYMVIQLSGQAQPPTGDFTNAATAEVRDAQGVVILRGQFIAADEDDDDIERKATLEPIGVDTDAGGEAEVEFSKAAPENQEIEFSVRNLQPGVTVTFVIDGTDVASAMVDRRGRAEVELDVLIPGAAAAR